MAFEIQEYKHGFVTDTESEKKNKENVKKMLLDGLVANERKC